MRRLEQDHPVRREYVELKAAGSQTGGSIQHDGVSP